MYIWAIVVFVACSVANFTWEAIRGKDWRRALEISLNEAVALGLYVGALSFGK
jgi:hypothetical protein